MLNNFKILILGLGLFLSLGHAYGQQITAIAPANGQQGQTLSVSITGNTTTFQSSGTINKLWLNKGANDILITSLVVVSDTRIDATLSISCADMPGLWDVVYTDLSGTDTLILANAFTISSDPSVSPNNACFGDQLSLVITSHCKFIQSSGTTHNMWLNMGASNINLTNATLIDSAHFTGDLTVPFNSPVGLWDVNFSDGIDTITVLQGFDIDGSPLSISPDSACIDTILNFTITAACGISFQSTGTTNNLWLNDGLDTIFMVNITVIDSLNLTADVDLTGAAPGAWDVVWTNSSGDTIVLVDSFWVDSCVSIGIREPLPLSSGFSIYPNPANSHIFLELEEISGLTQVSIYDLQGTLRYVSNTLEGSRLIDVSEFPASVYLLKLTVGKQVFVKKFTVQ